MILWLELYIYLTAANMLLLWLIDLSQSESDSYLRADRLIHWLFNNVSVYKIASFT